MEHKRPYRRGIARRASAARLPPLFISEREELGFYRMPRRQKPEKKGGGIVENEPSTGPDAPSSTGTA